MSGKDFNAYLAWHQLPAWIRLEAVRILRKENDLMALVRRLREEHGDDWYVADVLTGEQRAQVSPEGIPYIPSIFHMTVGMNVRNLLRRKGLPDKRLPFVQACRDYYGEEMECGNWDDFYVQACEEAADLRFEPPDRDASKPLTLTGRAAQWAVGVLRRRGKL